MKQKSNKPAPEGTEYRFVTQSGTHDYYYTLTVPAGQDPRTYFFEIYGEWPVICQKRS